MKAIKKVVALATGATMVGATIMGAVAADLANYPEPLFIENGEFMGSIVVGDKAAAEDVVGAIDIATSLQYSSTTDSGSAGESTEVAVEGDSWKVESSTKNLELGENFTNIRTIIGEDELNALADGSFTNEKGSSDYEQEMKFSDKIVLNYEEDRDNDKVGTFLTLDNSDAILNYTLTFSTSIESDIDTTNNELEDFKNKKINMLGKEYTITKADYTAGTPDLTLTLMGGAVQDTLEEGETKSYTLEGKEYEVEVVAISDVTNPEVKFKVNGEVTESLAETDTYKLSDGTTIGVRDLLTNEAGEVTGGDICEFYLGADKLEIRDENITDSAPSSSKLVVGEEKMDEVGLIVKGDEVSGSDVRLDWMQLIYTADDDYWFGEGEKLSEKLDEPEGLINWDIAYEGMSEEATEMIKFSGSGNDELVMKVTLADGEVDVPVAYSPNATQIRLGDNNYRLILDTNGDAGDSQGWIAPEQFFFITTELAQGGKSYMLKYESSEKETTEESAVVKVENMATSEDVEITLDDNGQGTRTFGGYEFTFNNASSIAADDFNITVTSSVATEGFLVTEGGAMIQIYDANETFDGNTTEGDIVVNITEVDPGNMMQDGTASVIEITANDANAANELAITKTQPASASWVDDPEDSDVVTYMSTYGAVATWDTSATTGPYDLEIVWPDAQLVGQAFVTSGEVKATVVGSGSAALSVQKIEVGTAKLASEISDVAAQNLILVGGPCANAAAAEVMGNPEDCTEGFEEGKAMVKLYDTGSGNVAMLVAGYSALDTRRASRVVANYEDYELSGDEVEVTGTSLSDISVTKVA